MTQLRQLRHHEERILNLDMNTFRNVFIVKRDRETVDVSLGGAVFREERTGNKRREGRNIHDRSSFSLYHRREN